MSSIYQALARLEEQGLAGVLCTVTASHGSTPRQVGSKMLVLPDGQIVGSVGGGEMEASVIQAALQALRDGQPTNLRFAMNTDEPSGPEPGAGLINIFVDPILPRPDLIVVGGGHVGKAVVHLGSWLDFRVVLSDDRPEFCSPEAVPGADQYVLGSLADLPSEIEISEQSYLVLTTRDVLVDVAGLPALLETSAAYIGILGSKRRWATTRETLIAQGVSAENLNRIVSPIGLELGAETPREIALSILAEVLMLRHGGDGKRMRTA